MHIPGLTPKAVESYTYLLGKDAQGKSNNWDDVPVGTSYTLMFADLKQQMNGWQGQSFVTGEGLYLSPEIADIKQVATMSTPVTIPLSTVLKKAITEDGTVKMGEVIRVTYKGKVNDKGAPVNYNNFLIEKYNSPELDKAAQDAWKALTGNEVDTTVKYSTTPDPVKGGELLVTNGVAHGAPAQQAPAPAVPQAPAPAPAVPQAPAPAPAVPQAPAPAPAVPQAPAPAPAVPQAPAPAVPQAPAPAVPQAPAPAPAVPQAPAPAPAVPQAPAPAPAAPQAPAPAVPQAPAPAPAVPQAPAPAPAVPPMVPPIPQA